MNALPNQRISRHLKLILSLSFLTLFCFCVLIALLEPPFLKSETDFLEVYVQTGRGPVLHFLREIGFLGSTMIVILISVISSIVFFLLGKSTDFIQFIVTVAGSGGLTGLSKFLVQRDRPTAMEETLGFYTSSFPSGHTLSATAMYLGLALIAGKYLQLGDKTRRGQWILITIALVLSAGVACARVLSRNHFPFDCLAGFLGGCGWAILVAWYFDLPFKQGLREAFNAKAAYGKDTTARNF